MKRYIIFNKERSIHYFYFRKQNRYGYTKDIIDAGLFTKEEADEITNQPYCEDIAIELPEDLINRLLELKEVLKQTEKQSL